MELRIDASAAQLATSTPPLPHWIVAAQVRGYVTAHRWLAGERRLFGTETLWGDWSGRVLVLAKDWGPSRLLRERIEAGEATPWRHEPRMRTNQRLVTFAQLAGIVNVRDERAGEGAAVGRNAKSQLAATEPTASGILYGSALANLLREDGRVSGALPHRGAALEYGVEVLRFVRAHMPALEIVLCLGREARGAAEAAFGARALDGNPLSPTRDAGCELKHEAERRADTSSDARAPVLLAAPHPAARFATATLAAPWRRLARLLRESGDLARPIHEPRSENAGAPVLQGSSARGLGSDLPGR